MLKRWKSSFLLVAGFVSFNLVPQECSAQNKKAFEKLTPELLRKLATENLAGKELLQFGETNRSLYQSIHETLEFKAALRMANMIRKLEGLLKKSKEQDDITVLNEGSGEFHELLNPPWGWAEKLARIGFKFEIQEILESTFAELMNAVDLLKLSFNEAAQIAGCFMRKFVASEYCDLPKLQLVFNHVQTYLYEPNQQGNSAFYGKEVLRAVAASPHLSSELFETIASEFLRNENRDAVMLESLIANPSKDPVQMNRRFKRCS